VQKFLSTSSNG